MNRPPHGDGPQIVMQSLLSRALGLVEIGESEVGFFLADRVSVGLERQHGRRVAELIRNPPDALPRCERKARTGVARAVELEGANALLLSTSP